MKNIFNSASKLVFVLMAAAVIGLTAFGKVDAKDFIVLSSMAFSFYFAKKQDDSNPPSAGATA